jgi:murein L,D-transpeptidase YcbB/YkuD
MPDDLSQSYRGRQHQPAPIAGAVAALRHIRKRFIEWKAAMLDEESRRGQNGPARGAGEILRRIGGRVSSMTQGYTFRGALVSVATVAALALTGSAQAQAVSQPAPRIQPQPVIGPAAPTAGVPMIQPLPLTETEMTWTLGDARTLLSAIEKVGGEGLIPADYQPDVLRRAIAGGEGEALNAAASKSFSWLAEDLRDGRTPVTARVQWFAVDPDRDVWPTDKLMAQALQSHDVAGVLAGLAPTHPDYKELVAELAATPNNAANQARRAKIQANLDRWRWLARDLGEAYLLTNVPEFQLRLIVQNDRVGHKIIRSFRTVVGKPGKTATPQLAEKVTAVVFNPTWTVPQSIVQGEGLGAQLLRAPRKDYKVTRNKDGTLTVVQQPGPGNSLGLMKVDMPNPHAIYLHDTPSKQYFNAAVRAYSHGCIRTERAVELGMTMAILGAQMSADEVTAISSSGEYTRVPMTRTFPVYLTYFTMARDIDGVMRTFGDIYGRDKPVLASFAKPREAKTTQRVSDEAIIKLDNPL